MISLDFRIPNTPLICSDFPDPEFSEDFFGFFGTHSELSEPSENSDRLCKSQFSRFLGYGLTTVYHRITREVHVIATEFIGHGVACGLIVPAVSLIQWFANKRSFEEKLTAAFTDFPVTKGSIILLLKLKKQDFCEIFAQEFWCA